MKMSLKNIRWKVLVIMFALVCFQTPLGFA